MSVTELPEFSGYRKLVRAAIDGQPPGHISVRATEDGPVVVVAGLPDGMVVIPVNDGHDVTDDPDTFRDLGFADRLILLGVVRERIAGRDVYTRVQSLYVVEGFEERDSGITDAVYHSFSEGYVNETRHNHRHLVSDPEMDVKYVLFSALPG